MSKTPWTPAQENAINARGMQVLVSAAAGSGKTAVLKERVKKIVTDTKNPCGVDEILVVTFTRAAAGEMKERIHKALKECEDADVDYIRDQIALLPLADICTIDSFCSKIVKDNFKKADVSVDFSLLDEKELDEMTAMALDEVVTQLYEENDKSFIDLTSMLLSERDDGKLTDIISDLYRFSRSYPSSQVWLKSLLNDFSEDKCPDDTQWAPVVYKHISLFADFYYKRFNKVISLLEDSGGFDPVFIQRFSVTNENLLNLKNLCDSKNWDGMVSAIREGIVFAPKPMNKNVDDYVKNIANDAFNEFKREIESIESLTLPLTQEHKKDCKKLEPLIKKLCHAVTMLEENLNLKKKERNAYSFDDILHKCIDLLVVFEGDTWKRTEIATSLKKKYKEIFIDEYQDTNNAQNIIFEAISDNCRNLFFVGDVKQSIYKFRLASPELFMKLKNAFDDYDGSNHPSQISLDKNFRSRKGITQVTNHVFKTTMSEAVGEIDYNDKESLVFGAEYFSDKPTPDVELLCLDYSDSLSAEATAFEAEQVAKYVERILSSKVSVLSGSGEKQIEASDICILLKYMKNKANVYVDALKKLNIPADAVDDGDVSLSKEIQFLVSLVKAVNNPLVDIPLVSVMFSPVFGFTADELAQIRLVDKNAELYVCLEKYSQTSNKAKTFINKLQVYRNIASSYPINEFVKFIVKDTDVENIYLAGNTGVSRSANIRGFVEFAETFTENGRTGLGAFVRSLDCAVDTKKMKAYAGMASPEGVQIMSIHKSKGLEFPYVIVADCSGDFVKTDAYKTLKVSRDTGIGLKIRSDENFTTYNTVSSVATEKDILYGSASESLRVLYVAMTRAKEHVTFVCTLKKSDGLKKKIRLHNYLDFDSEQKLHPYCVYKAKNMTEWLLTCFSQHDDCQIVRDVCEIRTPQFSCNSYHMDVSSEDESILSDIVNEEPIADVNSDIIKELSEKSSFNYKFDCSGILAKQTASSTERHFDNRRYFASGKPKFIKENFTGADRGTAIHKFFELCDFINANNNFDDEVRNLVESGKMTDKEISVVTSKDVERFFDSDVGKRLLSSSHILREYEFAFLKKVGEVYDNVSPEIASEEIVVQGKLDCAFIEDNDAILIDYKSDSITDPEIFKSIYKPQLDIYAQALEACTEYKVKEKYIYSFRLGEFIKI